MKYLLCKILFFSLFYIGDVNSSEVRVELKYALTEPIKCQVFFSLDIFQSTFQVEGLTEGVYRSENKESLIEEIRRYGGRFIEIKNRNRVLPVFVKDVRLVVSNKKSKNLNVSDLKSVGVILTLFYTFTESPQSLEVQTLLKGGVDINLRALGTAAQNYYLSEKSPKITWQGLSLPPVEFIEQKEHVEVQRSQWRAAVYVWLLVLVVSFFVWVAFDNRKLVQRMTTFFVALGLFLSLSVDLSQKQIESVVVLPIDLQELMALRLNELYRGSSAVDPEMLFERLQQAATGVFLNQTFVQLFRAKIQSPTTMSLIERVELQQCRRISRRKVECLWQLRAHVFHEGHIHEKDLSYKASFEMAPVEGRWLICRGEILPVFREGKR